MSTKHSFKPAHHRNYRLIPRPLIFLAFFVNFFPFFLNKSQPHSPPLPWHFSHVLSKQRVFLHLQPWPSENTYHTVFYILQLFHSFIYYLWIRTSCLCITWPSINCFVPIHFSLSMTQYLETATFWLEIRGNFHHLNICLCAS